VNPLHRKSIAKWALFEHLKSRGLRATRYHQANETQLHATSKLIRRILDANESNVGIFFNMRWFARMEKIMKAEVVKRSKEKFRVHQSVVCFAKDRSRVFVALYFFRNSYAQASVLY